MGFIGKTYFSTAGLRPPRIAIGDKYARSCFCTIYYAPRIAKDDILAHCCRCTIYYAPRIAIGVILAHCCRCTIYYARPRNDIIIA